MAQAICLTLTDWLKQKNYDYARCDDDLDWRLVVAPLSVRLSVSLLCGFPWARFFFDKFERTSRDGAMHCVISLNNYRAPGYSVIIIYIINIVIIIIIIFVIHLHICATNCRSYSQRPKDPERTLRLISHENCFCLLLVSQKKTEKIHTAARVLKYSMSNSYNVSWWQWVGVC